MIAAELELGDRFVYEGQQWVVDELTIMPSNAIVVSAVPARTFDARERTFNFRPGTEIEVCT